MNADTYVMRKFVLDRVHSYAEEHLQIITSEIDAEVFERLEDVSTKLVIRLETHVLAEKRVELERCVTFRYPASLWDHFKERHFPSWVFRRWPARYVNHTKVITFAEYATFPQMDPSLYPLHFGQPVIVQTSEVS